MATDIKALVKQMTLEEKASLLGGKDFWHTKAVEKSGIPEFMVSDGPHGLRKQDLSHPDTTANDSIKAVCFPAACATASSFDPGLIERMGEVIGNECQAEDVSIVLGPAVNIKRSPLCGRNFEYFSEDPYLAGKMASAFIRGVQSKHVGTSIKHFALNNQESRRMSISAEADERTIREIYFPAFEIAVRESQPRSVMCSYNKINGTYSSDNEWLLTKVLRDEWGFKGFVVTDWGAVNDRVRGVRAGLDLEMPGNTAENDARIVSAVKEGSLDEALVDLSCERLLTAFYDFYDNRQEEAVFDRDSDHNTAVEIAAQCAVLLENNGVLPLDPRKKTVYIGEFADKPRYQGGGSSHINASKVVSALMSARDKGRPVTYMKGFPADRDERCEAYLKAAVEAAKEAESAVIFAGLPDVIESEGYDRRDMKLPACQTELIEAVLEVQPNTVVVLHNGSPVEAPWADRCAAVLEMYLGGQGVGEATDRLLFGEANPGGHLPETFPMRLEDNPSYLNFPGGKKEVSYAEGVFVGYRYYEKKKTKVRWAFGHGLSYTTFRIDRLKLSSDHMTDGTEVLVSVDVTNTGRRSGQEVVQLYVADENGTPGRPVKELKGFKKVYLEAGETKTVSMKIDARSLAYFEEAVHGFYTPSGRYRILVGNSSDRIAQEAELFFTTSVRLPLEISGDITVGDLLKDPRTAPVMEAFKAQFDEFIEGQASSGEGLGQSAGEMTAATIREMPLKSFRSFISLKDEQMAALLGELKAACLKNQ